jgi:RHS repeat-associated protein
VITDRKRGKAVSGTGIQWFEADVVAAQQYYPFGMLMPGNASAALRRQYTLNSADYRYGFNGKEGDDEIKGDDNQQDYGMRIYDPRVGRFLSVDPIAKEYPWYTPYQFAGNMPIWMVDLDGLEPASPDAYKITDAGLKVLDGSAREQGALPASRSLKSSSDQPRIRIETLDVPYREKFEKAQRDNAVEVAKFLIVDPQALRDGDKLEWASVILGPIGRPFKGVKALRYGDNLVEIGGQVAKHSDEVAAKTSTSFFAGTKYTNKVLGQMKKGDFHDFPESVKTFEAEGVIRTIKGGDDVTRQMLEIPGEYGGKKGFFQFMKEADGSINHRFFKSNQ